MSLKGNLETFFFASVLQFLSNEKKTGILFVRDENENEVKVYIRDGTIIYATGSQKEARLAHLLKSRGIVSTEELKKCMETAREKKQPYGKILVENGLISIDMYKKFAKKQVEEIIYKLFLWKKGDFEYRDAQLNLDETLVINLNTVEVILEASRRIDEMSVLMNQIPNSGMVLKISEKYPEKKEIKLNGSEWHVLSLIDGNRTVKEIIDSSGYEEFPVYKLLFSLLSSGLIEKAEGKPAERKDFFDIRGVATVYADILDAVRKKADQELGNRTAVIFDESKSKLNSKQRILLRNVNPAETPQKNAEAVVAAARAIKEPKVVNSEFVITAFNDYVANLLGNLLDQLGNKVTMELVDSIEGVLAYVNTYHGNSSRKDMILSGIRDILNLVETPGEGGKAKGGVLSMFRR